VSSVTRGAGGRVAPISTEVEMTKKEWLWGPGRIAPEHQGLAKREVLERLAAVRAEYLDKVLHRLEPEEIPFLCRLERARFALLGALDLVPEDEFRRHPESGWSLADLAAHLLTHEEKNVDPEVNETLQHMAEHEESHLRQAGRILQSLGSRADSFDSRERAERPQAGA
jgi:hypothetical protein